MKARFLLEHWAMSPLHLLRSPASLLASCQLTPISFRSSLNVRLHVFFGLPLFLSPPSGHCHARWPFSWQYMSSQSSSPVRDHVGQNPCPFPFHHLFIGDVVSPWDPQDGCEASSVEDIQHVGDAGSLLLCLTGVGHCWYDYWHAEAELDGCSDGVGRTNVAELLEYSCSFDCPWPCVLLRVSCARDVAAKECEVLDVFNVKLTYREWWVMMALMMALPKALVLSWLILRPTLLPCSWRLSVINCSAEWVWLIKARSKSAILPCLRLMPKFVLARVFFITKSITMRKSSGDRIQPCLTPVTMSKSSVVPLLVLTQQVELWYRALKLFTSLDGTPYSWTICHSDLRWMLSKAFLRSM